MDKPRCSTEIRWDSWTSFTRCPLAGVVQRDGKWYCRQHDPERKTKEDDKREKRYEALRLAELERQKVQAEKTARRDACEAACEGVEKLWPGMVKSILAVLEQALDEALKKVKEAKDE